MDPVAAAIDWAFMYTKVDNGRSQSGMGLTRERWCCAGLRLSKLDIVTY